MRERSAKSIAHWNDPGLPLGDSGVRKFSTAAAFVASNPVPAPLLQSAHIGNLRGQCQIDLGPGSRIITQDVQLSADIASPFAHSR
jgi:hypothetical protein